MSITDETQDLEVTIPAQEGAEVETSGDDDQTEEGDEEEEE